MKAVFLLTFRNILRNRLRFMLTTFAVLLGVSFVVASFVLTDGLRSTFDDIIAEGFAGTDVQVQAESDFDEVMFVDRPIDQDLVEVVAAVDGVALAEPYTDSAKVIPLAADGDPIEAPGGAVVSYNWSGAENSRMTLVEGSVPDGPGEFAIDADTADSENMVVGATYTIIGSDGPEQFELVGINRFGEDSSLPGFVLVAFELNELQRLDRSEGLIRTIEISAEPGVATDDLIARVEAVMPPGIEAVSQAALVSDAQDDLGGIIDIFGNVLLAFALVAVFVSAFIISNTFNILLGQRVRQLSLLRAIGASKKQVRSSAVLEALFVGLVASLAGLIGGVLLAFGLRAMINTLGFTLPGIQMIISLRTIIVALIVGIGVTLVASLSPARRAAGVPPMAGMRSSYRFGSGEGTRRTIIAIVLAVLGAAGMAYSLFGGGSTALTLGALGLGAVLMFVSMSMFTPLFSSPAASAIGAPLEHLPGNKITAHMARQNASRNNKRTASTAAGLMIGLALIAMASVVATSLKSSFRDEMGSTLTADFLVTAPNQGSFSNGLVDQVAALPEFDEVAAVRYGNARVDGSEHQFAATDVSLLADLLQVDVLTGDPGAAAADPSQVLIHSDVASDKDLEVGDPLFVEFAASGTQRLTVGAIYDNSFLIGNYILDLSGWDANFRANDDSVISAKLAQGVSVDAANTALGPLEASFPQLDFETNAEFRDRIEAQLDSLLVVINVFLALAIIIALLGIANTMALSVLERTREIGLMRAIGMTRRQTRRLIRLEAGVVSLFGALLGVLVGIAFGWFAVVAIPGSFINKMVIPYQTLVIYVVIATIAGLLAASLPARRAAKLNILDAISHM